MPYTLLGKRFITFLGVIPKAFSELRDIGAGVVAGHIHPSPHVVELAIERLSVIRGLNLKFGDGALLGNGKGGEVCGTARLLLVALEAGHGTNRSIGPA